MSNSNVDASDESELPVYRVPRGGVSDASELPLNPLNGRELSKTLREHPNTGVERDLRMVAGNIRSARASIEKNTRQTVTGRSGDEPGSVTISPEREMLQNPGGFPAARRAKTQQMNLQSYYQRFAELCEKHFRLARK